MKKLLLFVSLLIAGCTYYTEKQSEAVSQNVYATNDSLGKARVDLAYFYSNETTKFIKPPKHPIEINSIFQAEEVINNSKLAEKTRVVIVPEHYKGDKIVVVGSAEYQELLKDRDIMKQLEQDNKNKEQQLQVNTKELVKQKEMGDKMVRDLNHLQAQVYKKDTAIWIRNVIILVLAGVIFGYIYLKTSKLMLF